MIYCSYIVLYQALDGGFFCYLSIQQNWNFWNVILSEIIVIGTPTNVLRMWKPLMKSSLSETGSHFTNAEYFHNVNKLEFRVENMRHNFFNFYHSLLTIMRIFQFVLQMQDNSYNFAMDTSCFMACEWYWMLIHCAACRCDYNW